MKIKTALQFLRFLPATFIVAVSWYLSSKPTLEAMPHFFAADKIVHTVCFAGLSFWVAFALLPFCRKILLSSAIFTSFYGAIDEFHQYFTPGRSCDFLDWLCDTAGAILGVALFALLLHLFRRNATII